MTNKYWYPYKELGSYFKLEEDVLLQCPMNADGTRDDSPCEVEAWDNEVDRGELIEDLQGKE